MQNKPSKFVTFLLGAAFIVALLVAWAAGRRTMGRTPPATLDPDAEARAATGHFRPSMPSVALHPEVATPSPAPSDGTRSSDPPSSSPPSTVKAPTLRSLQPELAFGNRVRELRALSAHVQVTKGRQLLSSTSAEDRALGGVLLFLNAALDDRLMQRVADDQTLSVPLVVFDWIRDFGADDEIAAFAELLADRNISSDELVAYAMESAAQPGGGRSALDLLLPRFDEEELADGLMPVASAQGASYDVREQTLFKLFEPEFKGHGLEAVEAISAGIPSGDAPVLAEAVAKWSAFAHLSDNENETVPYKVWDTPLRDVTFMANSDSKLAVRDMANYLEYGLRRDDSDFEPVIEEGTWQAAKGFLDRALSSRASLLPEDAAALDRIAASLDRLKAYDPAFAPRGDEDNPFADVPISDEILNAEDFYVAEYLTSDDEGEDPDEEEDPPGVSDDEEEDEEEETGDEEGEEEETPDDADEEEADNDNGDEADDEK